MSELRHPDARDLMKRRPHAAPARRSASRHWHIPPPLIHGPETLEGGGVLQDWDDDFGGLLWQASRDVALWATTDPPRRGQVFAPRSAERRHEQLASFSDAPPDPRVTSALETLLRLLREPEQLQEKQVAGACDQLSEWAEEEGKLKTALAFAQAAALTAGDAATAFRVATLAVHMNDHARAEVWFRRAVGLARRSRNWSIYSRAFGGLGSLYGRRGNLLAARRLHLRALRGARRGGFRREQAIALHDLFAVAVEAGNLRDAERLARQALDAYGDRNPRVHSLAHDVAYFWMEQGYLVRALAVFQAILPLVERPLEKLFVLADIARAAGGLGDRVTALAAAAEVWGYARKADVEQGAARALLEVARGLISLGESAEAEAAVRHAIATATIHRESKVIFAGESILATLQRGEEDASSASEVAGGFDLSAGDKLAADFVRTLETIAGAP